MCYPCTGCGRCGKYDRDSPLYVPPPRISCFACGGDVDLASGVCLCCGTVAFVPPEGPVRRDGAKIASAAVVAGRK